ncbi:MAG: LytR family transcriptional regulator [Ruminococcaceae bacterium]|nr:LytR family transcriptional regulator [Oscillospiraceae bacterium]
MKMDEREALQEPSVEEALKQIKKKQKLDQKRKHTIGAIAFVLAILAGLLVLAVLGNALLKYFDKNLQLSHIQLVMKGVVAAAVLSAVALILSVAAYALKNQKKGFAVWATIFSILILFGSVVAIYGYSYMFGAIEQDKEFNELSHEDLHVVQTEQDGEIDRDWQRPIGSASREDIESVIQEQKEENPDLTIEWEHITNEELPKEALEKMNLGEPTGKSYLTGDHSQIVNFALFGLDEIGSSDSIMIFSFDRVHHKLKLISIPRDSYIQVPAWGSYAKLAYPYSWGGAQWAVGTLNHNFAMNITEYIAVDMMQLATIIDLVGGVDVDLDYNEAWCLRGFSNIHIGTCHLGGEAAVEYARLRKSSATDNEEQRTGRQREVLISILNSLQDMSWTDYPEFIRACLGMCTTSFDNEQLLEICAEVVQNDYTIEQYALIEHMDYWGGRLGAEQYFYVVYDLNRASDYLYRIIYEDLYISGFEE